MQDENDKVSMDNEEPAKQQTKSVKNKKTNKFLSFFLNERAVIIVPGTVVVVLLVILFAPKQLQNIQNLGKIDDWQFSQSYLEESFGSGNTINSPGLSSGAELAFNGSGGGDSIGFAVGGAKDINALRDDISNDYLPLATDISYEGLFYEYLFDTGQNQACEKLFCPSYSTAVSSDPFSGEDEYFMSVGLNSGVKQEDFARKKLNIVIALDISGSMSSPFNSYYYDQFGNKVETEIDEEDRNKTKMEIANRAAADLLDRLEGYDSFGMVLFDNKSYVAKPLRKVEDTNMDAIKGHILELQPQGGTNMSAGMEEAVKLFDSYENVDNSEYENRIVFLTDAQPNTGALSEDGLVGIAENASENAIHSTFIGVGLDFNTELINEITKVRGANYYTVNTSAEFESRMDEGFDFMVTPLVFDLKLTVDAPGFEILEVYGSPQANEATGEVLKVDTLFPSEKTDGETRGGLVLLHMKKTSENNSVSVTSSYTDRNGQDNGDEQSFEFTQSSGEYDNSGIRKGVVLARYANLLKSWIVSERNRLTPEAYIEYEDVVEPNAVSSRGIPIIIVEQTSRWEQKSKDLNVTSEYRSLFSTFSDHLNLEVEAVGDQEMQQEIDLITRLINN